MFGNGRRPAKQTAVFGSRRDADALDADGGVDIHLPFRDVYSSVTARRWHLLRTTFIMYYH
jgi:hypothetical protein